MNPIRHHACKHAPAEDEHRCECGRLVAKRVPGGVELRYGRCKKPIFIPFEEDADVDLERRPGVSTRVGEADANPAVRHA